jgi:hypothetical protein
MEDLLERARAYLDAMEGDRRAALALSQRKAEEAKLIEARQEGFRAAMRILSGEISVSQITPDAKTTEPTRRRARRRIPELIVRELSFSGQAMTARQVAKAIDYNLERTEAVLERMEEAGQVLRVAKGRWAIGAANLAHMNGHDLISGNSTSREPINAFDSVT